MRKQLILLSLLVSSGTFAQGLVNNGSYIVLSNSTNIVIDGTAGNYTSQNGGLLTAGTGNGTMKLKGNWVNNAANTAFSNDGITTELNGTNQTIGGTNSTTFYNLSFSGSGTKTLDINTKAGGSSTMTGVVALNDRPLDLNHHTLEITNPSTTAFTRTNGYIISETNAATNPSIIQWNTGANAGTYSFPFGTSGNYIPVILDKTSTNASNISVATRATTSNNNTPWPSGVTNMTSIELSIPDASEETAIDRWWEILPSDPLTANLTLSYQGSENTTTTSPVGTFAIQRWNGYWEPQQGSGPGVTTGVGNVTATNVTDFSTFVLTTALTYAPLPVTLTDFSINCDYNNIVIRWATASELNSSRFVIEKSRDYQNWNVAGEVTAAGNSNQTKNYQFSDERNWPGTVYYRLVLIDQNGDRKEYAPVSTNCGGQKESSPITIYPNPANEQFTLEVSVPQQEEAAVILLDISGKMISERRTVFQSGTNQLLFDAKSFSAGTYILQVISESEFLPVKIIIQ
ncbi:MAG: T9SS type A sorting domain-containing protein [Flavobacteriia bacterium]|nr:T9SS type A sorting domain-containing protein [Flavobacteriia bacterium]OJX37152.1 MAG: hypothetical protein BGO87_15455 [Flavobacteriia bacterium 40-80]